MLDLTLNDLFVRIGLALVTGLVLGFEREQHGRAAGMRTTMLVCVAAAVAMALSEHLFFVSSQGNASWRPDPARLAAGVLAGMGFLGAGVIMRQDNAIHGVTTAALLWFSAIIGMAYGCGYFMLGYLGFGIAIIALFVLPKIEIYVQSDYYAHLTITSTLPGPDPRKVEMVVAGLGLGAKLLPLGLEHDREAKQKIFRFDVKVKKGKMQECQIQTVALIAAMPGVKRVHWS